MVVPLSNKDMKMSDMGGGLNMVVNLSNKDMKMSDMGGRVKYGGPSFQ